MDFFGDLTILSGLGLILALGLALSFEFVNGFHDTANAFATVIYTEESDTKTLQSFNSQLGPITEFIPNWVKVAVALALGCGTMIGWKRIVVTVGEKIGKEHLTYAQGASAELVAMFTIYAADHFGLPVSTTHVLSSGIAGTMAANGSGLQKETLKNILLAWLLTLPVCMFMGAALFAASLFLLSSVLGLH